MKIAPAVTSPGGVRTPGRATTPFAACETLAAAAVNSGTTGTPLRPDGRLSPLSPLSPLARTGERVRGHHCPLPFLTGTPQRQTWPPHGPEKDAVPQKTGEPRRLSSPSEEEESTEKKKTSTAK